MPSTSVSEFYVHTDDKIPLTREGLHILTMINLRGESVRREGRIASNSINTSFFSVGLHTLSLYKITMSY